MNKKLKIGIILFIFIFIAGFFVYAQFYYHAEKTATDYINGTEDVKVTKISNGLFLDGYGNDTAIIFYPGAKVEYTSYLPLFMDLSSKGVDCYLVEMPFNLAFFGIDSADSIIENSNYTHYYMAGHSLGGAMAASYVIEPPLLVEEGDSWVISSNELKYTKLSPTHHGFIVFN